MLLIDITNEYDEGGSLCDFGDHGVSCKFECESISRYKDNGEYSDCRIPSVTVRHQ